MAKCPIKNCNWKGKKAGLPVHLGRIHNIRKNYDSESNVLASQSKVCPVIGCGLKVDDLLNHARLFHPEWRMSDGRFVFEVE
jgi:hypothetical protein